MSSTSRFSCSLRSGRGTVCYFYNPSLCNWSQNIRAFRPLRSIEVPRWWTWLRVSFRIPISTSHDLSSGRLADLYLCVLHVQFNQLELYSCLSWTPSRCVLELGTSWVGSTLPSLVILRSSSLSRWLQGYLLLFDCKCSVLGGVSTKQDSISQIILPSLLRSGAESSLRTCRVPALHSCA